MRRMYPKYSHILNVNKGKEEDNRLTANTYRYKFKQHYHVRLDKEFKADCKVWLDFLQNEQLQMVVNRPMVDILGQLNTSVDIEFSSDASANPKLGFDCVLRNKWISGSWDTELMSMKKPSIEYLELFALCMGVLTWQDDPELTNCRIAVFCDNMDVVHIINNMTSGCPHCMVLVRILALNNLKFNRRLSARFISTKNNYLSDALSRGQLTRFRRLGAHMNEYPDTLTELIWLMQKVWQDFE